MLITLGLITAIILLLWQLESLSNHTNFTCPPNPCPSSTDSTKPNDMNNSTTNIFIGTTHTFASESTFADTNSTIKKRTYRESCDELFDCYVEYGLLCVYGWNQTKSCLCEGSHYWSAQRNKCRKLIKETN